MFLPLALCCCWVTIAIILHNLIIDVEGAASAAEFSDIHTPVKEAEDTYSQSGASNAVLLEGEEKQEMLIDVLMAWRVKLCEMRQIIVIRFRKLLL